MAIKKSDLYSSLWASCDELRGGMYASQYKDYVLFMLFIKYISDKYGNSDDFAPPVGELFKFSGGYSASRDQLSTIGHCYLHYGDIHGSARTYVDTAAHYQDIPKLDIPLNRVSADSLLEDGDVVFVDASEDDEGTSKHIVVVNKANHWLAGPASAAPSAVSVGGGITSAEEETEIQELNDWVASQKLPRGVVSLDFSDPQSGEQRAVFDLAWPSGMQEELSQPVAVLLNEDAATIRIAGEAGFRCFSDTKSFKRYVKAEVLGETVHA